MAEYFRDCAFTKIVLLLKIIFIVHFRQARNGLMVYGELAIPKGGGGVRLQRRLALSWRRLRNGFSSNLPGAITSIQAVYVPADDLHRTPASRHTFGHLLSTIC